MSLSYAAGLSLVLTGLAYVFMDALIQIFLSDAVAFSYGAAFARILLVTSFLFGIFFVLLSALQAMGAARPSLIVNVSRQGLIYVPALFILEASLGITGLVWAQPAADILSLLLVLLLYRAEYKHRRKSVQRSDEAEKQQGGLLL